MLQPGAFASNTLQWAGMIKASGAVFQPMGEGKMTPIDPHDIADVAVKVLTEPGHEGKSYELSGPESLTIAEQVAKISAAIGKPLRYVAVTPEAAREGMAKAGMPEVFINAMLELAARVREGHGWDANETVEQLFGAQGEALRGLAFAQRGRVPVGQPEARPRSTSTPPRETHPAAAPRATSSALEPPDPPQPT